MPRRVARGLFAIIGAALPSPRRTPSLGRSSSLGGYTVASRQRLLHRRRRRAPHVATAAHCARGMRVIVGGGSVRIVGVRAARSSTTAGASFVSGDGAFLKLAAPLSLRRPGAGRPRQRRHFTIAGYGTTDEGARGAFGSLHEATLVPAAARALVDPTARVRSAPAPVSATSGRPVMRGGMLSASSRAPPTLPRASPAGI